MINQETIARIKPGARVRVLERIKEKNKERQGNFEGVVLARKHGREAGATFTVRSVVDEVGVEKVYPLNSPNIVKVEVLSSPKKVHRAKLYYLRTLSNKKAKEKMKKIK